jgi:hypothetical protein
MKQSKAIGFSAAVLFAGLWALPLARAVSFVRWAQDYLREDMTLNAANDFHYSTWLLGCYAASLLATFAFAWLLVRRPRFWLLLPGALLAYAACEVLWLRPEVPIHLFPMMVPFRPALISVVAVAIAALFIYFPRRDHHDRKA